MHTWGALLPAAHPRGGTFHRRRASHPCACSTPNCPRAWCAERSRGEPPGLPVRPGAPVRWHSLREVGLSFALTPLYSPDSGGYCQLHLDCCPFPSLPPPKPLSWLPWMAKDAEGAPSLPPIPVLHRFGSTRTFSGRCSRLIDIIVNKERHERWSTDGRRRLPPAGGGWEGGTGRTGDPQSARPPRLPPSCLPPLGGDPRRGPRGWGSCYTSKSLIPDNVYFLA